LLEADAVQRREGRSELPRAAVGVAVQLAGTTLESHERGRERPERPLVRRQFHDALETELALDLLDRLAGLVRHEVLDRATEERASGHTTGGVSSSSLFLRQNSTAAPVAAAKPRPTIAPRFIQPDLPLLAGTARFAFLLATFVAIFQTAQPRIAFRLFMTPIALLSVRRRLARGRSNRP
jgi:hypothetical protein